MLLATVARAYLVFLCTLAAAALIPAVFGWQATVVETGSMQPRIAPGDVAVLAPLSVTDPVPVGGVVQFRPADRPGQTQLPVLHRVTAAHEDGTYTTAGDANPDPDLDPLRREQITGMGRLLVPWIGLPGLWWNTGNHLHLGLWLAATVLALGIASRATAGDTVDTGDDEGPGPREGAGRTQRLRDTVDADGPEARTHRDDPQPPGRRQPDAGCGAENRRRVGEPVCAGGSSSLRTGPVPAAGSGGVGRRAVPGLAGVGLFSAVVGYPATRSNAAFTARTTTSGSWSTASSFSSLSAGRAAAFALLATTRIEDKIASSGGVACTVSGLIGTSAGTITGYPATHQNSPEAVNAVTDARALLQKLKSETATTTWSTSPGAGATIKPGVYSHTGGDLLVNNWTLDAQGDPNAVFIIRAKTIATPSTTTGITVALANGAKAANVYWCADNNIKMTASSKVVGTWIAVSTAILERSVTLTGQLFVLGDNATTGIINTTADTIALPA